MKSLVTLILLVCPLFVGLVVAQDAPPKRADDIGVADFDTFKNNSFNIMDEATKADGDIVHLDGEIKAYAGAIASANLEKLTKDYNAISGLNSLKKTLTQKIGALDEQGKAVLQSAKDFSPKTKSLSAVSMTKKAIGALDFGRKKLTSSGILLKDDAALLAKELKARGAKIEEFVE